MRWSRSESDYAARFCLVEIAYLDDLEVRIKRGELDLLGYR